MRLSMRLCAAPILGLLGILSTVSTAKADIYAPGDSIPEVSGDVFGWNRGDAGSTYNGWDFFEATADNPTAGFTDVTPDAGQFGTVGSFSVSPGAIQVGSGNIYSPFAALNYNSIVASGTEGANTRIVAQFRTSGAEIDYSSLFLSSDVSNVGTIAPTMVKELSREGAGGTGGANVDYLAMWDLNESQAEYRIDFSATGPHVSFAEFHVDSFTSNTAFLSPTAIPEPSAFAALGLIGTVVSMRRRRRQSVVA